MLGLLSFMESLSDNNDIGNFMIKTPCLLFVNKINNWIINLIGGPQAFLG